MAIGKRIPNSSKRRPPRSAAVVGAGYAAKACWPQGANRLWRLQIVLSGIR
jgi:hypothetical protein